MFKNKIEVMVTIYRLITRYLSRVIAPHQRLNDRRVLGLYQAPPNVDKSTLARSYIHQEDLFLTLIPVGVLIHDIPV